MKNQEQNTNNLIKVSIVDDDQPYRDFLKKLLGGNSSFKIYGEYNSGTPFITDLESPFKPDVCLIDIMLPDVSGIECGRKLKEKSPDTFIIIMTAYPSQETLAEAKKIGADYIEKGTVGEKLIDKIIINQNQMNRELLISVKHSNEDQHNAILLLAKELELIQSRASNLSNAQRKVLLLKQSGKSKEEIAQLLKLSPKTIQVHINQGEEKLQLKVNDSLFKYIKL